MIGRLADWFNSRRWFIRLLLYVEWVILATFATLVIAISVYEIDNRIRQNGAATWISALPAPGLSGT